MSKTDYQAGKRYELVKAALNGGCKEMIDEIDNIINYIDTGDRKYISSKEERTQAELKEVESKCTDAEKDLEIAKAKLEMLNGRIKQALQEANTLVYNLRKRLDKEIECLLSSPEVSTSNLTTYSGKYIAREIEDCSSVYIVINGAVHRVEDVSIVGKKALLSARNVGYRLDESVPNGISQKEVDRHIIDFSNAITSIKALRNAIRDCSIYY